MVIQRWQSVLLLLAVVLMCIFCATPLATYSADASPESLSAVYVKDAPVLLTVSILVAALLFISIFLYKNLKRQMTVTLLSIVLIVATMVTGFFVVYNSYPGADFVVFGGIVLLVVTLILALGAYRLMRSDLRKLRSYDRLR
ncbi:MAG: DUF4293 domain-containing protein [Muribaculaceae bacterium]|nr:DUF4293 domain-containing protein [Muribaculaceae bacterium]MDE6703307.1 DUF4293 domain-containing protein [Muribaculaceae bacterium]